MKKRIITILTVLAIMISVAGCSKETAKQDTKEKTTKTEAKQEEKQAENQEEKTTRELIFKAKNGELYLKNAKDLELTIRTVKLMKWI